MSHPSPDPAAPAFGKRTSLAFVPARQFTHHAAHPKTPFRTKCLWCWHNLCRLVLIKVWFQLAGVLSVMWWWLLRRDIPSTLATVSITLVLSTWMMSRERIRRSLAGDHVSPGLGGKMDDDWSTFARPLLCLDE